MADGIWLNHTRRNLLCAGIARTYSRNGHFGSYQTKTPKNLWWAGRHGGTGRRTVGPVLRNARTTIKRYPDLERGA